MGRRGILCTLIVHERSGESVQDEIHDHINRGVGRRNLRGVAARGEKHAGDGDTLL